MVVLSDSLKLCGNSSFVICLSTKNNLGTNFNCEGHLKTCLYISKQDTNINKQETNIDKQETNIDKQETNIDKQDTNIDKQESKPGS